MVDNNNNSNFLERFAINLNERAAQGKLDPVIGRDDEIRHQEQPHPGGRARRGQDRHL